MREHKFRAWDKVKEKWIYFTFADIYGYEAEVCGVVLPDGYTMLNQNSGYQIRGLNTELEIYEYTGLKDSEEQEIYEGDIVVYTLNNGWGKWRRAKVAWNGPSASFVVETLLFSHGNTHLDEVEIKGIIGNIYESPELLNDTRCIHKPD